MCPHCKEENEYIVSRITTNEETNDGEPYVEHDDLYQCPDCLSEWHEYWEEFNEDDSRRMVG